MKRPITRRQLLKSGLVGGGAILLLGRVPGVGAAEGMKPRFLPVSDAVQSPFAQADTPTPAASATGAATEAATSAASPTAQTTPTATAAPAVAQPPQPPMPAAPQDPKRPNTPSDRSEGEFLTQNTGARVSDDQNTLRAGVRGPSLLEDHHFREKITQFDHERIPERVVHARGAGAHGVFRVTTPMTKYSAARFLQDPAVETPVFVRFSTVNGSRGSADTSRDIRGFATRFYTDDGNFDLVGNNIPVFFIQDAIKFPDLVHSFKPEPRHEMPQASTAHDSFWDFISQTPESMHTIMWVMSGRAIPRSYRMMEGFGVHTFRLVNAQGNSTFVKFHWRPILGVHSLVWDEALHLHADPDFHRRDLWQAIEMGAFPEWDLGVQLLDERDQDKVGFDVLDATKIWPEDLVPVQVIGRMTLNKNPDNYFEETEQVAFHLGHVVPGIDFTDDPLLQGRLFSYLDTQLNRFNSPNWHQLPINRPRAQVNNYQQDGAMRYSNRKDITNYEPTSRGIKAVEAKPAQRGFVTFAEAVTGTKVRQRSDTFSDYFSQATMFWNSMTPPEQAAIIDAFHFEIGRVVKKDVQTRMLGLIANVDDKLAAAVAEKLGMPAPAPGKVNTKIGKAKGLSETEKMGEPTIKTRVIAILAADGVTGAQVKAMQDALKAGGANYELIAPHLGTIKSAEGPALNVDKSLIMAQSVQYDAVYVPGGAESVNNLKKIGHAIHFVAEAYKHLKAVAATAEGQDILTAAEIDTKKTDDPALVVGAAGDMAQVTQNFTKAIAQHRNWNRKDANLMQA